MIWGVQYRYTSDIVPTAFASRSCGHDGHVRTCDEVLAVIGDAAGA